MSYNKNDYYVRVCPWCDYAQTWKGQGYDKCENCDKYGINMMSKREVYEEGES